MTVWTRPPTGPYHTTRLWNEELWDYDEFSGIIPAGITTAEWVAAFHKPPFAFTRTRDYDQVTNGAAIDDAF